jgi:hypothetical protein
MCTRDADGAVADVSAKQLRFFPAHNIFPARFGLGDTRENAEIPPFECNSDSTSGDIGERGGSQNIGRFLPALARASHARN